MRFIDMHVFGLRSDDATANLAAKLPNASIFGLWLVIFPFGRNIKLLENSSYMHESPIRVRRI